MPFYNEFSSCLSKQLIYLNVCHRIEKVKFFLMITVSQFSDKAYDSDRAVSKQCSRFIKNYAILFEPPLYNCASMETQRAC